MFFEHVSSHIVINSFITAAIYHITGLKKSSVGHDLFLQSLSSNSTEKISKMKNTSHIGKVPWKIFTLFFRYVT